MLLLFLCYLFPCNIFYVHAVSHIAMQCFAIASIIKQIIMLTNYVDSTTVNNRPGPNTRGASLYRRPSAKEAANTRRWVITSRFTGQLRPS